MSKHSALNNFGRSGNPAFQSHFNTNQNVVGSTMTLEGTVNKTGILLALCLGGAFFGWNAPGLALPAVIIGFIIALFTIFRPKNSPYTAPAYAAIEGVALGAITMVFEAQYPGIGIQAIIHSNGLMGIGFSLFVVGIASLNLVLDFDFIEEGSEVGLPKYMEWYGAFSLMVTLVWLYLEILRLLAKIRSR